LLLLLLQVVVALVFAGLNKSILVRNALISLKYTKDTTSDTLTLLLMWL